MSKASLVRQPFTLLGRADGANLLPITVTTQVPRHAAQLGIIGGSAAVAALSPAQQALLQHRAEEVTYTPADGGAAHTCYLFSVIVALEWAPTYQELKLLRDAFDRCADLLFDLTDGYMTFGQVIVGGPELLSCADIQIHASNRLHPRAWVDGLHDPEKYQPIRVGRGLWSKADTQLYPWHTGDGPAVLVHEWAHYGLGLKDQYMTSVSCKAATLVVPERNPVANTLMANLKVSELLSTVPAGTPSTEWPGIKVKPQFNGLAIPAGHPAPGNDIPPEEVPVPAFLPVGSVMNNVQPLSMLWSMSGNLPNLMDEQHCWIYVLKSLPENKQRLIAQGIYSGQPDEFPLLGADVDDTVIAVGSRQINGVSTPSVAYATIAGRGPVFRSLAVFSAWQNATPQQWPTASVRGTIAGLVNGRPSYTATATVSAGWNTQLFAFDEPTGPVALAGGTYPLTSLDGHLLLTRQQDSQPLEIAVATFSIGGCPPASFPGHLNPIPAGSADGNSMIFFSDPTNPPLQNQIYTSGGVFSSYQTAYGNLRIVVTTNLHDNMVPPAAAIGPRSYGFAVETSDPFNSFNPPVSNLNPTLVLYIDPNTLVPPVGAGVLTICRLVGGIWTPMADACVRLPDSLVALPLTPANAPGLYAAPPQPEFYRVVLF